MKRMHESTELLHQIKKSFGTFMDDFGNATAADPETLKSKDVVEFWYGMKGQNVGCMRAPHERLIELAGEKKLSTERKWNKGTLLKLSLEELVEICTGMHQCQKHLNSYWNVKDNLVEKILRASDFATGENPFGLCSKDAHCVKAGEASQIAREADTGYDTSALDCTCPYMSAASCAIAGKAHDCYRECPGLSGHCGCKEGYCFENTENGAACVRDKQSPNSLGVEGMRTAMLGWIRARQLEIGSAKKALNQMAEKND